MGHQLVPFGFNFQDIFVKNMGIAIQYFGNFNLGDILDSRTEFFSYCYTAFLPLQIMFQFDRQDGGLN